MIQEQYLTEPTDEQLEAFEQSLGNQSPIVIIRKKVCAKFNTTEIEFHTNATSMNDDLIKLDEVARLELARLNALTGNENNNQQQSNNQTTSTDAASEAQLNLLRKLKVQFNPGITKTEASDLISKSKLAKAPFSNNSGYKSSKGW